MKWGIVPFHDALFLFPTSGLEAGTRKVLANIHYNGSKYSYRQGCFLDGEAQLQKGAHDKDLFASVHLKRVW